MSTTIQNATDHVTELVNIANACDLQASQCFLAFQFALKGLALELLISRVEKHVHCAVVQSRSNAFKDISNLNYAQASLGWELATDNT